MCTLPSSLQFSQLVDEVVDVQRAIRGPNAIPQEKLGDMCLANEPFDEGVEGAAHLLVEAAHGRLLPQEVLLGRELDALLPLIAPAVPCILELSFGELSVHVW